MRPLWNIAIGSSAPVARRRKSWADVVSVVRGLSSEDVDELFDLREALEVLVCRRAAVRLDGPGGEALRAVLDEAGDALAAGDVDAAVGANARFHAVLLQVSRSPALQSVLEPVNGRLQWLLRQHPDPQVLYEEHRAIARGGLR